MTRERVLVGLSGGVDSAVAAHMLKQEGFDVIGAFIRTWHPPFIRCTEAEDRLDAMRVAAYLTIPFVTIDARDAYERDVARVMIDEYSRGRTPNPDMLCNRVVKFGVMDHARERYGAAFLATGHYARIMGNGSSACLHTGVDPAKDQSYFLAHMPRTALAHTLFPLGPLTKTAVRAYAHRAGLPNADRKDSQGICFLGAVDMHTFLGAYITLTKGDVRNEQGEVIGTHDGVALYTIGERHGFRLHAKAAAAQPHYVVHKDLATNTITVAPTHPQFTVGTTFALSEWNVLASECDSGSYYAVLRYHARPVPIALDMSSSVPTVTLQAATEHVSAGQTCVLYRGDQVMASGIIEA